MTNTEIRIAQVKVPNGDLQIDAYLAEPAAEAAADAWKNVRWDFLRS